MLRGLSTLLWITFLSCTFLLCGINNAEADEVLASWYGPGFAGLPTASGEPFDPYGFTAAHRTLPFGTKLLVSYGGRSVEVTVNDRGPYVSGRDLDLSQGAAEYLGLTWVGVDYVECTCGQGGYGRYGTYDPLSEDDHRYSQPEGGTGEYVVQSGDTLSGIAAGLGTTVEHLAATNGITNPDLVYIGQTIHY